MIYVHPIFQNPTIVAPLTYGQGDSAEGSAPDAPGTDTKLPSSLMAAGELCPILEKKW